MSKIFVVDDDHTILTVIKTLLTRAGHTVALADDGTDATSRLESEKPDMLITDIKLPGTDGLTIIKHAKQMFPSLPVIVITAHSDVNDALTAMKNGASDYMVKPFNFKSFLDNVERGLRGSRNVVISSGFFRRSTLKYHLDSFIGDTPVMHTFYSQVQESVASMNYVFLYGAPGTGKSLTAKTIHAYGQRKKAPFVLVDCAAIPTENLRQELFGFRNMNGQYCNGLLITADGGTIYLRNIELLPDDILMEFMKALATREVFPFNMENAVQIDVRLIASSHCLNLAELSKTNPVWEELLHSFETIRMPLLQERIDDIPALISKLLDDFELEKRRYLEISEKAVQELTNCSFAQGNLDELADLVWEAAETAKGESISLEDVRAAISTKHFSPKTDIPNYRVFHNSRSYSSEQMNAPLIPKQLSLKSKVKMIEYQYIIRVIAECGGDKEVAANRLGISLATLYRKLEKRDNMEETLP